MDHHCPFTRNCAGRATYGHFYLFLLYATLGLLYGAGVSAAPFVDCWLLPTSPRTSATCAHFGDQSLAFLAALGLLLATSSLFALHTVLLLADISTLEAVALLHKQGVGACLVQVTSHAFIERRGLRSGSRPRRFLASATFAKAKTA
jgi:hypothetical protein